MTLPSSAKTYYLRMIMLFVQLSSFVNCHRQIRPQIWLRNRLLQPRGSYIWHCLFPRVSQYTTKLVWLTAPQGQYPAVLSKLSREILSNGLHSAGKQPLIHWANRRGRYVRDDTAIDNCFTHKLSLYVGRLHPWPDNPLVRIGDSMEVQETELPHFPWSNEERHARYQFSFSWSPLLLAAIRKSSLSPLMMMVARIDRCSRC